MGSPGTWEVSCLPVGKAARAPLEKWSWLVVAPLTAGANSGRDGYGEAKATKPSRMGHEKSESADSTGEDGEPDPRDPLEGRGRPDQETSGGNDDTELEP